MESKNNFRIEAAMRTPAIIQGALTLESLLAASVFEATGKMREDALALVPINTINANGTTLWLASSVFFDGAVTLGSETIVRRRRPNEMGPNFYEPNLRARKDQYACDQSRGDFKALTNTYPTIEVERLAWFGNGDAEQCVDMLRSLMWIGKRRGQGFGQIAGVKAFPTSEHPLINSSGLVRRPIDATLIEYVPGAAPADKQHLTLASVGHPSWAHPQVLCAIPEFRELRLTEQQNASLSDDAFYE